MKDIIAEITRWVGTTFAKISWKKVLTFSFFVFLATIFWVMQVYREPFETTLSIPVKYSNIPDNIIFDNELPLDVKIKIKDDGAALFRYFFTKRHDTIVVDVKKFIQTNKSNILQNSAYEEVLRSKLLYSSEIKSYIPARISFEYSILQHKKVPVIFDGQVIISPVDFMLDGDILIKPDSVTVYGSKETIDTIQYAYTVADTISDLVETTSVKVNLKNQKNLKFVPSEIELYIPIDNYTGKELIIPIQCINMPEDLDVKIFPSNIHVSFIVGLSHYNDITANDFAIELDYNELKNIKTMRTPVRLTSVPTLIRNITLDPTEVEFVFEKKNPK